MLETSQLVIETQSQASQYGEIDLENSRANVLDIQTDISGEFVYVLTSSSVKHV